MRGGASPLCCVLPASVSCLAVFTDMLCLFCQSVSCILTPKKRRQRWKAGESEGIDTKRQTAAYNACNMTTCSDDDMEEDILTDKRVVK